MDSGTLETPEGKVVGIFMKQLLGQKKVLELTGAVVDNQLRLVLDQTKVLKSGPWDDRVVGLYRQQRMFKDRKVKPGDEFSYLSFEPSINAVVPTYGRVKEFEVIERFAGQEKKRLLRVETRPGKIENVQLPPLVSWLDEDRNLERSQVEVPGLGLMVLYRANKAVATAPGILASLTDIGLGQSVRLRIPIFRAMTPHRPSTASPFATRTSREPLFRVTIGSRSRMSAATPWNCTSRRARRATKSGPRTKKSLPSLPKVPILSILAMPW